MQEAVVARVPALLPLGIEVILHHRRVERDGEEVPGALGSPVGTAAVAIFTGTFELQIEVPGWQV